MHGQILKLIRAFILALDEVSKQEAHRLAIYLRKLGLRVEFDYKNITMKHQFRLSINLMRNIF